MRRSLLPRATQRAAGRLFGRDIESPADLSVAETAKALDALTLLDDRAWRLIGAGGTISR